MQERRKHESFDQSDENGEEMKEKSDKKRKEIICELMEDKFYVPMKEKELAMFLQVEPEDRPELSRLLNELLMEHKIQISKRGKYTKAESNVLCGTFIGNSKGFGFVEVEGFTQDYYIPADYTNGAFHQDIVEIELLKKYPV